MFLSISALSACSNDNLSNTTESNLVSPSEFASLTNEKLPVMIGNNVRFDNVVGWEDKFTFNYTLLSYTAEEIDVTEFRRRQVPMMINRACTTPQTKIFFDKDVTVTFNYYGRDGKRITSVDIDKNDCQ